MVIIFRVARVAESRVGTSAFVPSVNSTAGPSSQCRSPLSL